MTETQTTLKRIEFNENIIAFLGFAILLVSAVLWVDRPPTMEKTGFSVTYIGSGMVYLGEGSKLYDLAEQRKPYPQSRDESLSTSEERHGYSDQ